MLRMLSDTISTLCAYAVETPVMSAREKYDKYENNISIIAYRLQRPKTGIQFEVLLNAMGSYLITLPFYSLATFSSVHVFHNLLGAFYINHQKSSNLALVFCELCTENEKYQQQKKHMLVITLDAEPRMVSIICVPGRRKSIHNVRHKGERRTWTAFNNFWLFFLQCDARPTSQMPVFLFKSILCNKCHVFRFMTFCPSYISFMSMVNS